MLENLVTDMLKLRMLNTGMPFERNGRNGALLSEIASVLEPMAQKKGQVFTVTLPSEEIRLNIDPAQIADAITNLLDNAIKYADDGGQIQLIAQKSDHNVEIRGKR